MSILNNQPKLKQITGGLQIRQDVDGLLPLLLAYEASKVTTTVQKSEGVFYTADELLAILLSAKNTQGDTLSGITEQIDALKALPISDFVKLTGKATITDGAVTSVTINGDVATLVPSIREESVTAYTLDNRHLVDSTGKDLKVNVVTKTFSAVPHVVDNSGETITYIPMSGELDFKVFPIGTFTLANLPQDYLLDNEEMNLIYYANAIDDLAFELTKNSDLIDRIAVLVGETAVADAIAQLSAELSTEIDANTEAIAKLNDAVTVEGSIAHSVSQAITPIDERVTTVEGKVEVLEGADTVEGSVAYKIKEAIGNVVSDASTAKAKAEQAEADILILKGADTVEGSVAKTVKDAIAPLEGDIASLTTIANRADQASITAQGEVDALELVVGGHTETLTKLEGADTVEGSVANKIKVAIETITTEIEAVETIANRADTGVNTLNGADTVEGSVAHSVKTAKDTLSTEIDGVRTLATETSEDLETLSGAVTTNTEAITKLNGDDTVEGSVANKIKVASETLSTEIEAIETVANRADAGVNTLNGTEEVAGSVAHSVKTAKDALTIEIEAVRTLATEANTNLGNLTDDITTNAEAITKLATKVQKIETITATTNGQTLFTFASGVTAEQEITTDIIKLLVNGIAYAENSAFTVSRENKTLTWISTTTNGGFDLETDDMLQVEYFVISK